MNSRDIEGLTSVHLAAMRSELDVYYLLKAGADGTLLKR